MMQSYSKKNILITGGAGFIGSNLAIELVKQGANVTILDALLPDLGGNLFNLSTVISKIQFLNIDLRNFEATKKIVRDFDIIFNLAGNVSHQDSMAAPLVDLSINTTAQFHLLEAVRLQNQHAIVVYTSTRQIYGVPLYLPVDEKHPIVPVDVNGICKFAAEQLHTLYAHVHAMKTVCLRLTNTFGPRQLIKHSRLGFVGWFINRVLQGLPIELYGGGDQLRDFNYVDDVVTALLACPLNDVCFGKAMNLSGERSSLRNLADELIRLNQGGMIEKVDFPTEKKKIDIGDYYGSSCIFEKFTGWAPKISLSQGLQATLAYYNQFKSHYFN